MEQTSNEEKKTFLWSSIHSSRTHTIDFISNSSISDGVIVMGWEDESCCCGYVYTDCVAISKETGCRQPCLDEMKWNLYVSELQNPDKARLI